MSVFLLLWWCWLWSGGAFGAGGDINALPPEGDCEVLRLRCAYRANCARSLHSYAVDCADVLAGRTTRCPIACQRALISLTSHEIGRGLANCHCGDNEFCRISKERAEVCRPLVARATADGAVVPCSVATWICAADPLCSTALEFYHRLCRSMFHGRKCTLRCNNSLDILGRQEKAAKLRNCYCDGSEDYPCHIIQQNIQRLCYGKEDWFVDNYIPTTPAVLESGKSTLKESPVLIWMVFLFVLWTFRTNCAVTYRKDCVKYKELIRPWPPRHLETEESWMLKAWPWWWTSESGAVFGS